MYGITVKKIVLSSIKRPPPIQFHPRSANGSYFWFNRPIPGPAALGRRQHAAEAGGQNLRPDGQEPRRPSHAGGVQRGQQGGPSHRAGPHVGRRIASDEGRRSGGSGPETQREELLTKRICGFRQQQRQVVLVNSTIGITV